jgi:hypothetical protein
MLVTAGWVFRPLRYEHCGCSVTHNGQVASKENVTCVQEVASDDDDNDDGIIRF